MALPITDAPSTAERIVEAATNQFFARGYHGASMKELAAEAGVRSATLVFGLPGNPVSSLVGCELFAKPAVRALQGLREPLPRLEPGRLATPLRRNTARDEFVRARSRLGPDGAVLEPLTGQESHMIVRAAAADALVHVPQGEGELEAGAPVSWLRLDWAY